MYGMVSQLRRLGDLVDAVFLQVRCIVMALAKPYACFVDATEEFEDCVKRTFGIVAFLRTRLLRPPLAHAMTTTPLMATGTLYSNPINTLHKNLSVPVTAKFRIFPSIEKAVEYAKMLEHAGAQIIACHSRTREQRGVNTGLASYEHIRAVKSAASIQVFENGKILSPEDVDRRWLAETGADGVMSAIAILYNTALFAGPSSSSTEPSTSPPTSQPIADLALSYLSVVRSQSTRTSPYAMKGHLFKILRPALGLPKHHDMISGSTKFGSTCPQLGMGVTRE
ncbi:hypothetical protein H0H92_014072, partial [Tricholoma furcatifolium]